MRSTVVLLAPKRLTEEARHAIGRQLHEWDQNGRPPVVLDDGMHMSVLGGMGVQIALSEGPLDGARLHLSLATLDDLPESIEFEGGAYRPLRVDEGLLDKKAAWIHSTDGALVYGWNLPA